MEVENARFGFIGGDRPPNAPAESLFANLKKELVHHEVDETRTDGLILRNLSRVKPSVPRLTRRTQSLGRTKACPSSGLFHGLVQVPNPLLHIDIHALILRDQVAGVEELGTDDLRVILPDGISKDRSQVLDAQF